MKANRPVVVFAFDWIARWLPLRMTLDTGVVGVHIAEAGRVEDGGTHRMLNVGAARPVALLAADVPFTDGFGRDVIVHRMAAIAERTSRALEIISPGMESSGHGTPVSQGRSLRAQGRSDGSERTHNCDAEPRADCSTR